jgi:hypothetical protein
MVMVEVRFNLEYIRCVDVEWIKLAQNRFQWWDLVDTVMNLCVS